MKQHPILFNGAMVRAILSGQKTQTRRVVKIKPPLSNARYFPTGSVLSDLPRQPGAFMEFRYDGQLPDGASFLIECPYGQAGDRLWVRETFQPIFADEVERHETDYKTGEGFAVRYPATDEIIEWVDGDDKITSRCTPSIHMPRWASRITLEITGVRVEHLQDISEEDSKAEGVLQIESSDFERPDERNFKLCPQCGGTGLYTYHSENGAHPDTDCTKCDSHKKLFKHLWNSTGGDWEENPWVWVLDFKRVEQ